MQITEIFPALQGEAVHSGRPCVFVRVGGCNLRCPGFGYTEVHKGKEYIGCDSIFSVHTDFKQSFWDEVKDWREMVRFIDKHIKESYEKQDIIFTGGEPLIYHTTDVMVNTIKHFISNGYQVWFETNGTLDIDFQKYPIYKKCHFVISPKLESSGEKLEVRCKPMIIDNIVSNTEESVLKFVVDPNNIEWKLELFDDYLINIPTLVPVYLMPMGGTKTELESNAGAVYKLCEELGFRYSDRLHIRMYDDKKGV